MKQKLHQLQNVRVVVGITRFHMRRATFPQVPKHVWEETMAFVLKGHMIAFWQWVSMAPQRVIYTSWWMHKNAFILPVSFALVCSMSSRPNVALGGKCSNFLHGLQYAKYSNVGFQLITPVAVERFAQWPPSLSLVPAAWTFSNIIWVYLFLLGTQNSN